MKPYLHAFLKARDDRKFREFVETFTQPAPGACRRVAYQCWEVLRPQLARMFPLLSEDEQRAIVLDRVASLDWPADLDELRAKRDRAGEDSTFELSLPESEPQGPPRPDLEDRLDGRRTSRTRP